MPPPPSKKAKSATTSVVEPPLGPITSRDSLFDSDSDLELADDGHESEEEGADAGSSDSNSDEEAVPSAPPSPPPTVMKRKRGRKARQFEHTDAAGS
jgi:hypothetical protein